MIVKNWQTPKVVFQPDVILGMQRGIDRLVHSIRPTLGPVPRTVVIESTLGRDRLPEMLDNGGVIARRITQLSDRDEDAGAMLLRHMLWELHEKAGDGTATAAVIFQSVFDQGARLIAAGGDAHRLRIYLERGAQVILGQLEAMKAPIRGSENLIRHAETLCHDPELAQALGEIYASLGEYVSLDIRPGRSRELEREVFQGMYWQGGLVSRLMARDLQRSSIQVENASVLLSDLEINEPEELLPLLELAARARLPALLVVASKVSERALSLILSPGLRERIQFLVVKTPGLTIDDQWANLQDLAILTAGRPLLKAAGDRLSGVQPEYLGRAGQVYADLDQFGILRSNPSSSQVGQYLTSLKAAFACRG